MKGAFSNWQLAKQNQPQKQNLTADCADKTDQRGLEKSGFGYWPLAKGNGKKSRAIKAKAKDQTLPLIARINADQKSDRNRLRKIRDG